MIRAYTRATLRQALARFAAPFTFVAKERWARAGRARSARSCRGLAIFSPVDRIIGEPSPASTPIAPDAGACSITSPHSRDTNQRPAASCDTVTVDGDAPSGNGCDHTIASGCPILASVSVPSRQRIALAVYSAERRDLFLLLNTGYRARLPQKLVNAACKCRSACCSGTDETSLRKASSSVFLHPVSRALVVL
ncbi:hypothetical protein AOZ06_37180 [Kibdelosporangium phytohabitans]|uniref:Uncharacterized protein n=1 Tax=Kibdelosporangium phytohabitans TaxID=860235 RepID=A0A0N9IBB9_9PSEU|nr:hypothetical protein AOZ06_37180 [Kibdelosporangium phytohabitans]